MTIIILCACIVEFEQTRNPLLCFLYSFFVCEHSSFYDGNGRAARLLEMVSIYNVRRCNWYIQSERYYYQHVNDYYKNLNRLGMFYEKLDYAKADRFLQMLLKR